MQQVVSKNLGGRLIAETFSRGIIVYLNQMRKVFIGESHQVGLAGQGPAQAADGVFDAALLPGRVGLTEEGFEAERMEGIMPRKLRPVIEGDRLAPRGGQGREEGGDGVGDRRGGFAGGARGDQQAGVALMEGQDGLAVDPEQHQIGLPMARGTAIRDRRRPLRQRAAQSDKGRRAAPLVATAPAFGFGLRQIVAPGVLCFAGHLRIDEAVDGLVGDDRSVLLPSEAAGHLLGGPAVLELRQDRGAERAVAVELGALPAARPGLLVGIAWAVALGGGPIAVQLPSHSRWRAIQSCRDLADRVSRGV